MGDRDEAVVWRTKGDRAWLIGSGAEVAWIEEHAYAMGIAYAVTSMFEAYATVQLPVTPIGWCAGTTDCAVGGWTWNEGPESHDASVLGVLSEHTAPQAWWLGYLKTGPTAETIFYDVRNTTLYGWEYVLIEAGPEEAGRWRADWGRWKGVLPDLMFPADRSWLASTLWDEYWMSIGGSRELVDALLAHPELRVRVHEVDPSVADVTPPQASAT